jgi:E3 ubiquitin-protein ligase synoviolin
MTEETDPNPSAIASDEEQERRRRRDEEMERWLLQQENDDENAPLNQDDDDVRENNPQDDLAAPPQQQLQQQLLLQHHQQKSSLSWLSYRPASFIAFVALLWYALRTRKQYYLAVVYLTSSKWAYLVIGNAILATAVTVFDVTVKTFLSGLRLHEAEGLQDFFRWNVTETCLALTMFRNELTIETALQFVALITVKCLHHVTSQREQHLRMTEDAVQGEFPYIRPSHLRLVFFLLLLQGIDMFTVQHAVEELLITGPTVKILFAFEAAILLVSAWSHILLWQLHVVDSAIQYGHEHEWPVTSKLLHPWKEYKATMTFAVELQAQAVNFVFYSTFFAIVLTYYGVPINLFREVYLSFAKLKERLTAFFNYRRLMASMNRFRSATDEELEEAGRTCIICRDEMCTLDCKRLPVCAHTFHKSCLREWLVQQQSCPTCRADIAAMEAQEAARNAAATAATDRTQQAETQVEDPTEEQPGDDSQQQAGITPRTAAISTSDSVAGDVGQTNRSAPVFERRENKKVGLVGEFEKVNASDFGPALYEAVHDVAVWSLDDLRTFTRTIPAGLLVLCLSLQRHSFETGETIYLLRIPDGWIREDSVRKVYEVVQNPDAAR